jgi:hypothetical protein
MATGRQATHLPGRLQKQAMPAINRAGPKRAPWSRENLPPGTPALPKDPPPPGILRATAPPRHQPAGSLPSRGSRVRKPVNRKILARCETPLNMRHLNNLIGIGGELLKSRGRGTGLCPGGRPGMFFGSRARICQSILPRQGLLLKLTPRVGAAIRGKRKP